MLLALIGVATSLSGCGGPAVYQLSQPRAANTRYATPGQLTQILVRDTRGQQSFTKGSVDMEIHYQGAANEVDFLTQNLVRELSERGIPISGGSPGSNGSVAPARRIQLDVSTYRMRNRQPGGMFAGFNSLRNRTSFVATASDGQKSVRIVAYIKHSKIVQWSDAEDGVRDHLVSLPQELIAREVVSKLNRHFYGLRSSPQVVANLVAEINRKPKARGTFRLVYRLGYTNSPHALAPLSRLVIHEQEMIRLAAITSLGVLGDPSALGLLQKLAFTRTGAEQHAAIKSIGDIGTPAAFAILQQIEQRYAQASRDHRQIRAVVALFR